MLVRPRSSDRRRNGFAGLLIALTVQLGIVCSGLFVASYILSPAKSFQDSEPQQQLSFKHSSFGLPESNAFTAPATAMSFDDELTTEEPESNRDVNYTVRSGDTLSSIWSALGATDSDADRAFEAIKKAGLASMKLRKGETIAASLSPDDKLLSLKKGLENGASLVVQGNEAGFEATVLQPTVLEEQRNVVGTIISSFASSATEQEVPYSIIDDFVDLFGGRVEFSKALQPGDSFTISYSQKRCKDSGKVLSTGAITEASIRSSGKLLAAIRYKNSADKYVYYNEAGEQMGAGFLRYPLQFTKITSSFSWARFHPVLQRTRPHLGVDFAAPIGTPIRSVADGVIEDIGFKAEPGNWIKIDHGDRYSTAYMHMQKFSPGLRKGMKVSRGQVIGFVGMTGLATGPHLHFSLYDRGQYTDPLKADLPNLVDDSSRLPKNFIVPVMAELQREHQMLLLASVLTSKSLG